MSCAPQGLGGAAVCTGVFSYLDAALDEEHLRLFLPEDPVHALVHTARCRVCEKTTTYGVG